jgi:hypothetical protein
MLLRNNISAIQFRSSVEASIIVFVVSVQMALVGAELELERRIENHRMQELKDR